MFREKTHSCILFQIIRLRAMSWFFYCTNSPTSKTLKIGLENTLDSSFSSEPCAAHRLGLLGLNLNKKGVGLGTLRVPSLGHTFLKTTIRLPPTQTTLVLDTLWYGAANPSAPYNDWKSQKKTLPVATECNRDFGWTMQWKLGAACHGAICIDSVAVRV